jgi:hypothetical protein
MKILYELDNLPNTCSKCPLSQYEVDDNGEYLYCVPLTNTRNEQIDGDFLKRRKDCPLKIEEK